MPDTNDEHAWTDVINLGSLIDVADEVSERLFALSKLCVTNKEIAPSSLAPNRGLPPNPSAGVRAALSEIDEHETKYGKGEFGGYTHASWAEVKSHEIDAIAMQRSDWKIVFDLVRQLEHRFTADRIRFVVWFVW